MLGLRFCARAFSSCGERGPLFIAVRRSLTISASLVAEHRLQTRRLSSCGARAPPLRGMWDLPRPGLELVSPALAGRFSTTVPPGKPYYDGSEVSVQIRLSVLGCKPPKDRTGPTSSAACAPSGMKGSLLVMRRAGNSVMGLLTN